MITLLTPTADQPFGFALCEIYMARQELSVDVQWLVVDDGTVPARVTMGQDYLRRDREAGCSPAQSLCRNLLFGLPYVRGDALVIIEHDDWYAPRHIAPLLASLERPGVRLAGDGVQRYFNVATRQWRIYKPLGACLCGTAMRPETIPTFEAVLRERLALNHWGVDGHLWQSVPRAAWAVERRATSIGIKGLPGRPGIGVGHRPGPGWSDDPTLERLRLWIGADVERYRSVAGPTGAPAKAGGPPPVA